MFEKITESDIAKHGMAAVSTTPNRQTAFGESGMSAAELKARFDALPTHIAERLNEMFEGIPDGALVDALKLKHGEALVSVAELIRGLLNGDVENIQVKTLYKTISLATLGARVVEIYNGLDTGELAEKLMLSEGESLADFHKETKAFTGSDVEKIAAIVLGKVSDVMVVDIVSRVEESIFGRSTAGIEYVEEEYERGTLRVSSLKNVTDEDVYIPKMVGFKLVTGLGDFLLENNKIIKRLTIPDTVKYCYGLGNLYGSFALEEINIGAGLGEGIELTSNINLKKITVSNQNENYASVDDVLYSKNLHELICYPPQKEGETFEFLPQTTYIADNAFEGNAYIKTIVIPPQITRVGCYSLCDMCSLEAVYFTNPEVVKWGCFGSGFGGDVYVPWSEEEGLDGKDDWFSDDPGNNVPTVHYNWDGITM